jgi:8-oxo-dGTP diphosphatase
MQLRWRSIGRSGSRRSIATITAARRSWVNRRMSNSGKRLLLVAACALVDADGRVLLAQRPEGKPTCRPLGVSGRQGRAGRDAGTTLIRELREELGDRDRRSPCLAPLTFASHL